MTKTRDTGPSLGAKLAIGGVKIGGEKKIYSLPEDKLIHEVKKINKLRGFFMPPNGREHYEDELIFGKYHCLKIMHGETPAKHAILFFFGGGFIFDADRADMPVATKLALESGCDMWYPYYPLCIEHDIKENIEMGFECYRKMIAIYGAGNVSTCGYSAGGMLAIEMGLYNNSLPEGERLPMPRVIVAVSPGEVPCDEEERERMKSFEKTDYVLDFSYFDKMEKLMRHGNDDIPDWMIHPVLGDFSGFPKIYFYYSTNEILYGAWPRFEAACKKYGVEYEMDAKDDMFHCYCMAPIFREARETFGEIIEALRG